MKKNWIPENLDFSPVFVWEIDVSHMCTKQIHTAMHHLDWEPMHSFLVSKSNQTNICCYTIHCNRLVRLYNFSVWFGRQTDRHSLDINRNTYSVHTHTHNALLQIYASAVDILYCKRWINLISMKSLRTAGHHHLHTLRECVCLLNERLVWPIHCAGGKSEMKWNKMCTQ